MIVPVMEAASHWCPFMHLMNFDKSNPGSGNRYVEGGNTVISPVNCRCLGSGCMAWLWVDTAEKDVATRKGCCGLAHNRAGEL